MRTPIAALPGALVARLTPALVAAGLFGALLSGCPRTCPSEPLAPQPDARWIVRFNERPPSPAPVAPIPGIEMVTDPPGIGAFAALALYDGAPTLRNERWLDPLVSWDGATGAVDAAVGLPAQVEEGRATLLLAGGARAAVTFTLASGEVSRETAIHPIPPAAGGQLFDLAWLGAGTGLATRRRDTAGGGGDVVVIDEAGVRATLALSELSRGEVQPGRVAALAGSDGVARSAIVGLGLPDEAGAGAVALVDLPGSVLRVDIPELGGCHEVVALPPSPSAPATARAAILCAGDLEAPASARTGAGFVLVERDGMSPLRLSAPRRPLFPELPTQELVALDESWVAALSPGDPRVGRPDQLMVVDLASDAGEILIAEPWSEAFGPALGSGAYAADLGELWWPSARSGIRRWRKSGATFEALPNAPPAECIVAPPRVVRSIPMRAGAPPPSCAAAVAIELAACDVAGCVPTFASGDGGEPIAADGRCEDARAEPCAASCPDPPPPCPSGTVAEGDGACFTGRCVAASLCPAP